VTATHTELNRLDANLGAFLSDSITDATGTVDVITATYSYAPALTDKTTLLLRAAGANTSTTPTFNPNGLGAKTITKLGNQALVAGDIYGAAHVLILQYNSSNDVWELLNPYNVAPPVTGYNKGSIVYINNDGDGDNFDASTNVVESTWESVGPTGSGADNIFTAMDIIPSTATAIILRPHMASQDATGGQIAAYISARRTGSTINEVSCKVIGGTQNLAAGIAEAVEGGFVIVPLDSSLRFDAFWYNAADTTQVAYLYFMGWIDDH